MIMKKALLTRLDYDKILKLSPDEIGKYLEDFEYKNEVDELAMEYSGIELIERTLQLNLGNKFDKLLKISPQDLKILITLYLKRYDIYNIKTILRSKFSSISPEDTKRHLNPASVSSSNYFDKLISQKTVEEIFSGLDFLKEKDTRAALDHFKNSNSLVYIENVLDRYYFNFVFSQSKYLNIEGKLYKKFLFHEIDVLNIKLLLRLKKENFSDQDIKEMVFHFGTIRKEIMDKMLKADVSGILKELENTDFRNIVEKYSKDSGEINFSDLEIDLDKFLLEQSKKLIRQHPMSVDVILGYMFLKDLEVKNLTRIVKAKQLSLSEEFIEKTIVI